MTGNGNNINISQETSMIWNIANILRGPYQAEKYKDVIIPMTILRRIECETLKYKNEVVELTKQVRAIGEEPTDDLLKQANGGGYCYNMSPLTLESLLSDPAHLAEQLRFYIHSFDPTTREIMENLEFDGQITKMEKNDRLYNVIKSFSEIDLAPERVDNIRMGYIFEDLIRRFSENAEAGDHYTSKDEIACAIALLITPEQEEELRSEKMNGKTIRICDYAAGTGGIVSALYEKLIEINPMLNVEIYAQEINPESYAICKAEMLIKGQDPDHVKLANSLKDDKFADIAFDYIGMNPPFGVSWAGKEAPTGTEEAVKAEYELGADGRYPYGYPGAGDSQLLFMQMAQTKLKEGGRAFVIQNGSSLFAGNVGSGESQIRRHMLEDDVIDTIVQQPTDMFYNTGIATYIWILDRNKPQDHKDKLLLIDASQAYHKLRKAMGEKRNELTENDIQIIKSAYLGYDNAVLCAEGTDAGGNVEAKVFPTSDFIYKEYTVMQPEQKSYQLDEEKLETMLTDGKTLKSVRTFLGGTCEDDSREYESNTPIYNDEEQAVIALRDNIASDSPKFLNKQSFIEYLETFIGDLVDKKTLDKIADAFGKMDKTADIVYDKKGNVVYDKATKDVETIKGGEDVDEYMAREVLPYVPDAKWFFEEDLGKKKPVIKTGAEIPFTRLFYKFEQGMTTDELAEKLREDMKVLEGSLEEIFA